MREETISKDDFSRLRSLIYEEAGIALSPDKRTMVEIRIKRRLRIVNPHKVVLTGEQPPLFERPLLSARSLKQTANALEADDSGLEITVRDR